MSRETKVGLVVAGSFICLAAIVVATKFHSAGPAPKAAPTEVASVKPANATPEKGNAAKPKETVKSTKPGEGAPVKTAGHEEVGGDGKPTVTGTGRPAETPVGLPLPPTSSELTPEEMERKKALEKQKEKEAQIASLPPVEIASPARPATDPRIGGDGPPLPAPPSSAPPGPLPLPPPPDSPPAPPSGSTPDVPVVPPPPTPPAPTPTPTPPIPEPTPAAIPKPPTEAIPLPPPPSVTPPTPPLGTPLPPPPSTTLLPGAAPMGAPPVPPPPSPEGPGAVVPLPPMGAGKPDPVPPPPVSPPPDVVRTPTSATGKPPALPPMGAVLPPMGATVPAATQVDPMPRVKETNVSTYECKPEDTTFSKISSNVYGTEKYGEALRQFNARFQDPPVLKAGQKVKTPPVAYLEANFASVIPGLNPVPAIPLGSGVDKGPADKGPLPPLGSPSTVTGSTPPPPLPPDTGYVPVTGSKPAAILVDNPNRPNPSPASDLTVGPPQAVSPPPGPAQNPGPAPAAIGGIKTYRVPPQGQHILEIAQKTLGDRGRWPEIYRLNANLQPQYPIPGGTELRLPPSAVIPSQP